MQDEELLANWQISVYLLESICRCMRIIVNGVSLAAKLRSEKCGCWLSCRYSKRWCNRNTCSMTARQLQESGCPRLLLKVMWKRRYLVISLVIFFS
ncbi:hypothetical protein BT93_E1931 [Corymbia citriodora subsp. variegata]|nr:hypothetical protein BT93_E1931 [Corymbia citriodora subsp. variegata]